MPGNGYGNVAMVSQMLDYSLQPEDYWIKTLQNIYPWHESNSCALINQKVKCFLHFLGMEKDIKAARKCSIHHKNNLHKNLNYFLNSNLSSMLKLKQINAET